MKNKLQTLFLIFGFITVGAQEVPKKKITHFFAGHGGGIMMVDDGQFAIIGYATFVPGRYIANGSRIEFTPKTYPAYSAAARREPELKDKIRIRFEGFDKDKNYIQIDGGTPVPVFNDYANCFNPPYIAEFPIKPDTKTITFINVGRPNEVQPTNNSYSFDLAGNNDFIVAHHAYSRYETPFIGTTKTVAEGTILETDLYGPFGEDKRENYENDGNISEFLPYFSGGDEKAEDAYINRDESYTDQQTYPLDNYTLDGAANVYRYNGKEQLPDKYDDVLRKYKEIKPGAVKTQTAVANPATKPVFFLSCTEKSYRFERLSDKEEEIEMQKRMRENPPQTLEIAPEILPQPKIDRKSKN